MTAPGPGPATSGRGWWVAAAIAAVLSLGLPWWSGAGYTIPGWMTPATFVPNYSDGTVDMIPGAFVPSFTVDGYEIAGYQSSIRVVLVAVLVLLVLAVRRRSTRLATAAVATAVVGMLITGLPSRAGGIAYVVALACLVVALRRDGLLPARARGLARRFASYTPATPGPGPGAAPPADRARHDHEPDDREPGGLGRLGLGGGGT